jgi:hypothetical protein
VRTPLIAFAVATALVLVALPLRQEGSRTATDAYIPLRQLTAAEATLLLRADRAVLVSMDALTVELATRAYVLPPDRILDATWENYCSLYRLERRALEAALGRRVRADELRPLPGPVSFSPDRVVFYAVVEIVFLTCWITALVFVMRRVRRAGAIVPVLFALLMTPLLFVLFYSPAYADADAFHQRIVLEEVAAVTAILTNYLLWPAVLSLLGWMVLRVPARCAAHGQGSKARDRSFAQGCSAVPDVEVRLRCGRSAGWSRARALFPAA